MSARFSVRAAFAAATVLLLSAVPAGAVVNGQQDTSNTYANVGAFEMRFDGSSWVGPVCTGTLVRPDVVLTAAHCIALVVGPDGVGVENVRITFDPFPASAWFGGGSGGSTWYYVEAAEVHPSFTWDVAPANPYSNSKLLIGPGFEDVALVWLGDEVAGIEPAPIVGAGGLDALDLKKETSTVVGYGLNGFTAGNALTWRNPRAQVLWSGRNYRHVSVVSEHDLYPDRYVKTEAAGCFGDSGGPLFHGRTIVGVAVWAGWRCQSPNYEYRLDGPLARSFLDTWLD